MKKFMIAAVAAAAMAFAGTASAALVPGVFDPDHTGCPVAKAQSGYLHLEKNCATATNASAGANITGLTAQTFTSASFTLKSMLIDVHGVADVKNVIVNGIAQNLKQAHKQKHHQHDKGKHNGADRGHHKHGDHDQDDD